MPADLFNEDLTHILARSKSLFEALRGRRLFVTGGTGFIGRWLLESLLHADATLELGLEICVLTRDPEGFRARAPQLAGHAAMRLLTGDVRDFQWPEFKADYVIHGATEASAALNATNGLRMFETIVDGTRRTLDYAAHVGAQRVLLLSSGAVYGVQPSELTHVSEDYTGGPLPADAGSAYAEGKRASELLAALYERQFGLATTIARCFAFLGPYLPLDRHFAAGNFLRDALAGGPLRVNGDGTPYRSYMYPSDLVIWLLTILLHGQPGRPYNVGAEEPVTIAELARAIAAAVSPQLEVQIAQTPTGAPASRYVPCTRRAREELGLEAWTPLDEAIHRTLRFYRTLGGAPLV